MLKITLLRGKKKISEKVLEQIYRAHRENILNPEVITRVLGYANFENNEEVAVYPRGYRILNKIPKMPSNIVNNLVQAFKSFQHILAADIDKLDDVDGIGERRAKTIRQSLKRMREQFVFDNVIL